MDLRRQHYAQSMSRSSEQQRLHYLTYGYYPGEKPAIRQRVAQNFFGITAAGLGIRKISQYFQSIPTNYLRSTNSSESVIPPSNNAVESVVDNSTMPVSRNNVAKRQKGKGRMTKIENFINRYGISGTEFRTAPNVSALYRGMPHGTPANFETKYVDGATVSLTFTSSSATALTPLNLVQAGSSAFNRIGRKICLKSVFINGRIIFNDTPAANLNVQNCYLRWIVVYDSQTNGANPTWADVIQSTDQTGATFSTADEGFNLNNRNRFRILIDKRYAMPQILSTNLVNAGVAGTGPFVLATNPLSQQVTHLVSQWRRIPQLETQFKADSAPAVIGDISTGGLFIGCQAQGSNGNWALSFTSRVRFTD